MKILMTFMLHNRHQELQRGLVDLLEDGRVLWHDTPNEVRWWHGDFLTPTPRVQR